MTRKEDDILRKIIQKEAYFDLPKNAPRFSLETIEAIKKAKGFVYNIRGKNTIRDWMNEDVKIEIGDAWTYPKDNYRHQFYNINSTPGQVAILAGSFFLGKSDDKTLEQQIVLMGKQSSEISKKYPGARLSMLPAPSIVELAIYHYRSTGVNIFKHDNELGETFGTRTITIMNDGQIVNVSTAPIDLLTIRFTIHPHDFQNPYVRLARILVPDSS